MSNEPPKNYERKLNNYKKRKKDKEDSKKTMSQQEKRFVYSFLGCFGLIAIVLLCLGIGIASTSTSSSSKQISSEKTSVNSSNGTNSHSIEDNEKFVDFLNKDISGTDTSNLNEESKRLLLNADTMKFGSNNAQSVFLVIPEEYRGFSQDDKLKFAQNALYVYQEDYKRWIKDNKVSKTNPPMFYIKYSGSETGEEMAVWDSAYQDIELR